MTAEELKQALPNASPDFIALNADNPRKAVENRNPRVRPLQPEPVERVPLDANPPGEEACWHDAACRFEIVFTVYSRRPCDWDGYDIKALQDFLITAGIIPNDKWNVLSGRVVSEKAATEAEEKTVIEIRELKFHNASELPLVGSRND